MPRSSTAPVEGTVFVVTELLDGATLRERLATAEIGLARAFEWAMQIAQGLAAAHERGIVHRDLKPENVFVTRDSIVKILDFGLARRVEGDAAREPKPPHGLTEEGAILGTVGYLSPEQARGLPADHRSDIFAFDLGFALRLAERALSRPRSRVDTELRASASSEPAPRIVDPSIAVLPFRTVGGGTESEYFSEGMTEDIIAALSRAPGLRVAARTSSFAFRGKDDDVRRIGHGLGVATVLDGSVRQVGQRLRVTAQLIDVRAATTSGRNAGIETSPTFCRAGRNRAGHREHVPLAPTRHERQFLGQQLGRCRRARPTANTRRRRLRSLPEGALLLEPPPPPRVHRRARGSRGARS